MATLATAVVHQQSGIEGWVSSRAAYAPDRRAVLTEGRAMTYGELDEAANRLANGMQALYRIGAGDRVAIYSTNCLEYVVSLFALAKLGAIGVLINFRLAWPEIRIQLVDSGARLMLVHRAYYGAVEAARAEAGIEQAIGFGGEAPGIDAYERVLAGGAASPPKVFPEPTLDTPFVICYTSGTTGTPKGALLTQGNMYWNAVNDAVGLQMTRSDVTLSPLPLCHIGGIGLFLLPTLYLGGTAIISERFDPDAFLRQIERQRPTIVMGVPATHAMVSAAPGFAKADLSSVRFFYNGGDRCPLEVVERYRGRGVRFGGGYGLTESSPTAYLLEPEDFERGTREEGFIGRPAFCTQAKVAGPEGQEVAPGEVGEILLRGPNLFLGYWNRPQETAEAFAGGWFHTGDLARADEAGFTYIVGRKKEMFVSGGENVYPAEVERVLAGHPAVREVAVIGVPDAKWGEVPRAIVVLKEGAGAAGAAGTPAGAAVGRVTEEELIAYCHGRLARYKIPRSVLFVGVLPRTSLGKLERAKLKALYGDEVPGQPGGAAAQPGDAQAQEREAQRRAVGGVA